MAAGIWSGSGADGFANWLPVALGAGKRKREGGEGSWGGGGLLGRGSGGGLTFEPKSAFDCGVSW